jgi:hypothetical protein
MTSAGIKAVVVMALLFVGALLAWLLSGGVSTTHTTTTTRTHEHTTVLVEPQQTPLRDSGPKNNTRGPSASSPNSGSVGAVANPGPRRGSRPATSHPKAKKRQTPKTTPTPRPSSQGGSQGTQPSNPPPTQPPPLVGAAVPAPVHVCARPIAGVNC